jgi:HK97 family phage major capsid protein
MGHRQFSIGNAFERAADKKDGDLVVAMAFASQAPYERWWGIEVLDVTPDSVRLGRLNDGAPLLYNHDWRDLRGTHVAGSVKAHDDGVLRGKVRITAATQAGRDTIGLVESGVLTKASVGYTVHKIVQQTTAKAADGSTVKVERTLDGAAFERLIEQHGLTRDGRQSGGDLVAFRRGLDELAGAPLERAKDDEPDVYRIVDWEPFENSLVTIPADNTVGVGRSAAPLTLVSPPAAPAASTTALTKELSTMKLRHRLQDQATDGTAGSAGGGALGTTNTLPAQPRQGPAAAELEADRVASIDNLCRANNIDAGIRNVWVTSGASMRSISDELLGILQTRAAAAPKITAVGLSQQETRRFSMARAIEACASQNWTQAGLEAEASREIQKRLNRNPDPNRFFVPWEIQERANRTPIEQVAYALLMKRDLTVASAGAGGYLVETQNVGFIELLRNKSVLFNMGARRLSGLQGNVSIPKQSATGSATWLANEAATISEVNQTFVQVAMSPKNVGGYTEISRQLLLQSNPAAEGIVVADLASVVALDIDLKGLNGSGASGQPTGILNTAGIGSVTGTSLDYADVIEFQTDVFGGNALTGQSGYVTTGAVAGLLKQRVKFTSTASPLWEGQLAMAMMDGYRAMASNQMPSATMLFGDFDLGVVVGEWGVLEIETNPYANFQAGIVGVRAIASIDIAVRYPTAFSAAASIT